jgi:hypothetical protein
MSDSDDSDERALSGDLLYAVDKATLKVETARFLGGHWVYTFSKLTTVRWANSVLPTDEVRETAPKRLIEAEITAIKEFHSKRRTARGQHYIDDEAQEVTTERKC